MIGTDHESESHIRQELASGESILWTGRPEKWFAVRNSDIGNILVILLVSAFFVFFFGSFFFGPGVEWESFLQQDFVFILFAIVLFISIGSTVLRQGIRIWRRARTVYGLTGERVIIVSRGFGRKTTSLNLTHLRGVYLSENSGDTGTITFGEDEQIQSRWSEGYQIWEAPKLESIENARRVYEMILDAQRRTKDSA